MMNSFSLYKIFLFCSLIILLSGCTPGADPLGKNNTVLNNLSVAEMNDTLNVPLPDNNTVNYCHDFCSFVQGGENDKIEYNQSSTLFMCSCSDYAHELAVKSEITPRDLQLYSQRKIWWADTPITYQVMNEDDCGEYETKKIERAFQKITTATEGVITFQKVADADANIEITCKYIQNCYHKKIDINKEEKVIYEYESICAHAAGFAKITKMEGFVIKKATIDLIGLAGFSETTGTGASGFYVGSCGHPSVEVHEILHTFGLGHSNNPGSIMYHQAELVPFTVQQEGACMGSDKNIDEEAKELWSIYGHN